MLTLLFTWNILGTGTFSKSFQASEQLSLSFVKSSGGIMTKPSVEDGRCVRAREAKDVVWKTEKNLNVSYQFVEMYC